MSTTAIERAPKQEIEARPITPLSLIQDALHKGVPPEVLKELVALQQSMIRFDWEAQERQAKIDFDNALNHCQAKIGRVAPNVQRNDTRSMWADYVQLDRAIRPIYTEAGFSVSFSEVAPINPAKVRIMGTLSRGGVSREFFAEITPSTTGAKGNALVNATDADAIAQSRAKRYILLDMFNIAIGIDQEEKKAQPLTDEQEARLSEWEDALRSCPNLNVLKSTFADAYKFAGSVSATAKQNMTRVYEDMKRRLTA